MSSKHDLACSDEPTVVLIQPGGHEELRKQAAAVHWTCLQPRAQAKAAPMHVDDFIATLAGSNSAGLANLVQAGLPGELLLCNAMVKQH